MSEEQNTETTASTPAPTKQQSNPYLVPIAIVVAGLAIAGAILAGNSGGDTKAAPSGNSLEAQVAPVTEADHVLGGEDPLVYLIEYSDYQCPFCTRFHETVVQLLEEYEGKVAWVYRHFPLDSIHPDARPAAIAAECMAEQGGSDAFWAFTNKVFEEDLQLSPENYQSVAQELGLDMAAFDECTSEMRYDDLVQQQMENAMEIGGQGTPFNVLLTKDGQSLTFSGALPIERVRPLVDRALRAVE
jgi:protein-disulfide isomerase